MNSRVPATLAIVTATVLWGAMGFFTRSLNAAGFSLFEMAFIRMGITALGMGIIMVLFDRESFRIPGKMILLMALFAVFKIIGDVAFYNGQLHLPLAIASSLQMTFPYFVIVLGYFILKESITTKKLIFTILAFIGCIVIMGISGSGGIEMMGAAMALISALMIALDNIGGRYFNNNGCTAQGMVFYIFLFSMLISIPFCDVPKVFVTLSSDSNLLLEALAFGIVATLIPYYLRFWSLKRLDVNSAAVYGVLEMVVSTLLGWVVYGETLTVFQIAGVVLIVSASVLMNIEASKYLNRVSVDRMHDNPRYDLMMTEPIRIGDLRRRRRVQMSNDEEKMDEILKVVRDLFDSRNWNYDMKDTHFLRTRFLGDDLEINMDLQVLEKTILFDCVLSLDALEENYGEVMKELNDINDTLTFGSFRLNRATGKIHFQYSHIHLDSHPTSSLIESLVTLIIQTVDDHDGDLKRISSA